MHKRIIGFLIIILAGTGCAKTKPALPSTLTGPQVLNAPASSIRLFNFSGQALDVKVNNVPLTAFSASSNAEGNQIGLALFPQNVWPAIYSGAPVTLPTSLENNKSAMSLVIEPRDLAGVEGLGIFYIDTTVVDNPLAPVDYYVLASGQLKAVPRNSVAPANPQNFKVRIYNLCATRDTMGLTGNVTMTYADGTPVNTALSGIAPGTASPYVEMPYGSYQFKLYVAQPGGTPDYTKQLTELPSYPDLTRGIPAPQYDLTTLVRQMQPGGTYSLVVTQNIFGYDLTGGGSATYYLINAYRVITEQAAPVNTDWARIQGVNAVSTSGVSFTVDGAPMGSGVPYGQTGGYTIVSQGTHEIEAVDATGKVLSRQSYQLSAADNITAWAYTRNDTPRLAFTNTDMTGTLYESVGYGIVDDGTDGSVNTLQLPYNMQFRFLNLSDVPYLTFTTEGTLLNPYILGNETNGNQNDTLAYPEAYINLRQGLADSINPFVLYPGMLTESSLTTGSVSGFPPYLVTGSNGNLGKAQNTPLPLRAYASEPATANGEAQIPGAILAAVPTLTTNDFTAGSLIYPMGTPQAENGYYTVALIGSNASGNAHMIVIKHNK